eukprot:m.17590 g.17590  ORF g.17590 m.17590 type:complete len:265 (-) comp8320_c0_seq1:74-868(-)
MAMDYAYAACCGSFGQALFHLPWMDEPLCSTVDVCHTLTLSGPADQISTLLYNTFSFPTSVDQLGVVMILEVVMSITWFVTTFKVIEFFARAGHLLLGFTLHRMLGDLFSSRNLGEFWGRHWNRCVQPILKHCFFLPVYQEDKPLTLLLAVKYTFFMSGVLHAVPMLLQAPLKHSAVMMLFFIINGLVVVLEAPLSRLLGAQPKDGWSFGNSIMFANAVLVIVSTSAILFHFILLAIANVLYGQPTFLASQLDAVWQAFNLSNV